jgi:general secretion pathway protein I
MRARQAGFTLIEIVAAFVILTLVLATSYQIFSAGLQRAGDLEDYTRALAVAQSQIALSSVGDNFPEGQTVGESDDRKFHWTVSTSKYDEGGQSNPVIPAFFPVRIAVHVTWRSGADREKQLDLATLALARTTP